MLIDADHAANQLWKEALLNATGRVEYDIACTFEEAREFGSRQAYDIVFIDAGGEQNQTVQNLRKTLELRNRQPFMVLITEEESPRMLQRAKQLSMDDFIVKGPLYRDEITLHLNSFFERLRLQQALELSVSSYRELFEATPLPMLVIGSDSGKILAVNESAAQLFDGTISWVGHSVLSDFFEDMNSDTVLTWLAQMRGRSELIVDPIRVRGNRGEASRLRARIRGFQFGLKEALQLTIEDVSKLDREASSRDYVSVRETEAEKLVAVGQILSKVAHELNNPMAVIMGLTLLLLEDENLQDYRQDLETLQRSAERCNTVLQDVLRFTQMQGIASESVDLAVLAKETAQQFRPQCEGKGIDLEFTIENSSLPVKGDPFLLEHVIVAILTNAQEAILRGNCGSNITLTTYRREKEIVLDIVNDGPAIPKESWNQVFAPFFTTKRKGEGVGLSMFYCFGVINEHFGHLSIVKSDDAGTLFRIVLPLAEVGVVTVADSERLAQATPAKDLVILCPPENADQYSTCLGELMRDPNFHLTVTKDEDELLDETASIQPDFIVILSERVEKLEQLVGALSGLVFQKSPKVIVFEACWKASEELGEKEPGPLVTVDDPAMLFKILRT